ncbi:MAG: cyclopropane-fatty-acyl-phospholipid synthase [Betaproteobacteria bacterium RIFCSPLOWO2_12_FULL_63_13]|nr:MAG: cyclopropane-fatty-acyl-phospholipid synthase [Betaproteobacteria bacterium RIFCSPLOWO2_12_FULL_63_13]
MFIENRLAQLAARLRDTQPAPLRLSLWDGRSLDFGPDPKVTIVVPQKRALRCFLPPDLMKLGEAYVEGKIRVEGSLRDIFEASVRFVHAAAQPDRIQRLLRAVRHTPQGDRRAIEYHYDVSNDFYRMFLDRNMVYSCAYFQNDHDTLDQAQEQKLDYVLTKLRVQPGHRLLDIGCGWGALIVRAAAKFGCFATGITLSRNQYELARERIRSEGLQERCEVRLQDYRDIPETERYDRISSIGMFEHVGLKHLGAYFRKIESMLADDGVVLNHGITAAHPDNRIVGMGVGKFIDRYVFPDGELPHISLVMREMSEAGFEIADVESLRRHYARTCEHWTGNIERNRARAVEIGGEKRYRIWSIYLVGCAFGFARNWMNVYQVLAVKARSPSPLPSTRAWIYRHA